ncbi:helix-turn-helix domain-containing protein [Chthonobacter rhizosphaerae]|uniref:helix-turn-helix domain-containing protein n=1 Tax=Chthonobacter rhizosphaerae TaxID=2735553 RepID=UPI003CCC9DE1
MTNQGRPAKPGPGQAREPGFQLAAATKLPRSERNKTPVEGHSTASRSFSLPAQGALATYAPLPSGEFSSTCLMSLGETARLLGVSVKTLRRLYEAGELPVVRIGRQIRIAPSDLDCFIANRRGG